MREPVQAVRSVRIKLLEIRHVSYLGGNPDEMASVQGKVANGLQLSDCGRKYPNLAPLFGSDAGNRIQFIAAFSMDFLDIRLKRFRRVRIDILNFGVQRGVSRLIEFDLKDKAVT